MAEAATVAAAPMTTSRRGCMADHGRIYAAIMDRAASSGPAAAAAGQTDEALAPDGAGVPDGFERLWMPHRMAYIKGENKPAGPGPDDGCPFCRIPRITDAEGLIVARGTLVFAVLNLYPYNGGHLLICPYRHVADYTELDLGETAELAVFTKAAMTALRTVSGAHGFNIGMNMGGAAGAGIAAHLHQHVVPRWGGDANFMPVVARTKVLPQLLADTRDQVAAAWPDVR
jgi:ATP adenylyltransferase